MSEVRISTTVNGNIWLDEQFFINPSKWADAGPYMVFDMPDDYVIDGLELRDGVYFKKAEKAI